MQKDLQNKYNLERIQFFMNNKSKITEAVLAELRSHGLSGKQIALDILELKNDEPAQKIHYIEIEKCKADVIYFKDNYLLILNKDDLRDKMLEGIKRYSSVNLTSITGTGRSYAAWIHALWILNFYADKTIGIATPKSTQYKDTIYKITNLYECLPSWIQIKCRNLKTTMTSDMNTQITTDVINQNSFRGISLDLLIVDCLEVTKADKFNDFKDTIVSSLFANKAKSIYIGTNPCINVNADIEINEYTELPIITERPILKRTFKQIIKDYLLSLFKSIKG